MPSSGKKGTRRGNGEVYTMLNTRQTESTRKEREA
jgi:hypothetical protein